ncbi:membrane protein insertase YidC [Labrys wisconsinensis]|uniref:Membrane protein insertase YidC n=1 Tax=Labrys wisconsinensis TaxID=425677 RepID=A0ABU0JH43_9HYPH|nr:membrane protein insertase YidC [Labrys wisconsinensis]MDQ0472544.1 YidC/Oxa1 family membrane protein insertase [Labrys wisconsinensis]
MNGENKVDNKNMLLAIVLSAIVLIGWQYFVGLPQMQRQHEAAQQAAQQQTQQSAEVKPGQAPAIPGSAPAATANLTRAEVVASTPRVSIDTPRYLGSINLKGGRIDDLALRTYHETIDPKSPNIVLLSPSGSPIRPANHHDILENQGPYYADFGWVAQPGSAVKTPAADTVWTAKSSGPLTPTSPTVLEWDNGAGLLFHRTIAVDDSQMFTVTDAVENKGAAAVQLSPYALISRHGTPAVAGYYILHEGLIGFLGENRLQEYKYSAFDKEGTDQTWKGVKAGWLGFTDKYWATALIPDQSAVYTGEFTSSHGQGVKTYQTDILFESKTVAPGASAEVSTRLFSGAKEVALIDGYEKSIGADRFDLLIDWGWFYYITKNLFIVIDWLYHFTGNFGISILIVTLLLKLLFFPLANKSYESMAKMKKVQPEMTAIRERFADDKMKQQQAMMELYKRERINPVSGCVPVLLQIPVFFALYKVLFITIEMRHQPFFGWIHDLSAPDPTTIFNLFGLIPWSPPLFLMLGAWPLIMGVTMFLQMQLNPAPADPVQASLFRWMPLIFTFMLGSFPVGLVIYWTWNNTLTILQQSLIMKKNGVKIELWDNLKGLFVKKAKA